MPLKITVTKPVSITLSQPIAPNSAAASFDVLQIKKSLNRLGHYIPPADIGITDIPDSGLFAGIKAFQKLLGLPVTGIINTNDKTLSTINTELQKPQKGYYIWRTVHDEHVRADHAAKDGMIRAWEDSPDPGDDFNCRCWAEVAPEKIMEINMPKERIESIINNTPSIFNIEFDENTTSAPPWYENTFLARRVVSENEKIIEKLANKHNADPDMVKAVMWAENARGSWGGLGYAADALQISKTIMPMNINPDIWYKILGKNKGDFYKVETNIEASTILLQRIKDRIVNPTPEKVAAIWEYIGQERMNSYAAYIGRVYTEKPWKKVLKKR